MQLFPARSNLASNIGQPFGMIKSASVSSNFKPFFFANDDM